MGSQEWEPIKIEDYNWMTIKLLNNPIKTIVPKIVIILGCLCNQVIIRSLGIRPIAINIKNIRLNIHSINKIFINLIPVIAIQIPPLLILYIEYTMF